MIIKRTYINILRTWFFCLECTPERCTLVLSNKENMLEKLLNSKIFRTQFIIGYVMGKYNLTEKRKFYKRKSPNEGVMFTKNEKMRIEKLYNLSQNININ